MEAIHIWEKLYGQTTGDRDEEFVPETFCDPNVGCQVAFIKMSESSMEVVEGNRCGYGGDMCILPGRNLFS